nr:hypothetical protein L203_01705 [Cryptococcus depauperatus CBS 7841]
MFTVPNTPGRSSTWPRYITPDLTPTILPQSTFVERDLLTQSPLLQSSSPSPTSSHSYTPASPAQTPFVLPFHRSSFSSRHDDCLHRSPMQPSSQPFGIAGGLVVSEPGSVLPPPDCGMLPSDVFLSQPMEKSARPVLRPSFSHNAVVSSPTPSTWPRRVMTASAISSPRPAIAADSSGDMSRHEASTPSLTHSTSSTHPVSSSSSSQQYGYPHYTSTPPYNAPYGEYPYGTPYATAPYPQPGWPQMSTVAHASYAPQHHWAATPTMHATAMPSKQDEPILAPGELPAPRPPMSYAALIGEALLMAPPPHQLYVSEISDSIKRRYPYYRQNPTKIYNGVRHQTSMCKAFVKLPRPFGDQSGGARKWGIRAGCESWFAGGGYHPPSNVPTMNKKSSSGKAKSTARSKQLAIGTGGDDKKLPPGFPSPDSSDGPSSGPAYDGTNGANSRTLVPYGQPSYAQPFSSPPTNSHLPPGYHYIPVGPNQAHAQPQQPMYVPVWGPYAAPNPPTYPQHGYETGSQSPETWRMNVAAETKGHEGHSNGQYDGVKVLPIMGSPAPSVHSLRGSLQSSHGHSPESL